MTTFEQAARAEAERRFPARLPYNVEFERRVTAQDAFVAGASWLAEYLLSDDAVECAVDATWRHSPYLNADQNDASRSAYWAAVRDILSAALGTNHNEQEQR